MPQLNVKCILTSVGDDCVGTLLSGLVSGTRAEGAGGLGRSQARVVAAVVTGVWGGVGVGGDGLGVEGEGGVVSTHSHTLCIITDNSISTVGVLVV